MLKWPVSSPKWLQFVSMMITQSFGRSWTMSNLNNATVSWNRSQLRFKSSNHFFDNEKHSKGKPKLISFSINDWLMMQKIRSQKHSRANLGHLTQQKMSFPSWNEQIVFQSIFDTAQNHSNMKQHHRWIFQPCRTRQQSAPNWPLQWSPTLGCTEHHSKNEPQWQEWIIGSPCCLLEAIRDGSFANNCLPWQCEGWQQSLLIRNTRSHFCVHEKAPRL